MLYSARDTNLEDDVTYRTSQISKEEIGDRGYEYTYDKVGNITEIKEKTASGNYDTKVTYTYDALGQLKRENNVDLNKTIVYTYDNGGNITNRAEYPYTTGSLSGLTAENISYAYDSTWNDQLTSYNGQRITYDEIGNPETYRNGMTFTWQGRQMKTANLNGTAVTYKYNADGLRTYKKVGSTVHEYEYSGDKLFYEKRGDIKFYYRYDVNGNLMSITRLKADGTKFTLYAVCNSRGDVEELRKETGSLYARYVYDSWGNVLYIYSGTGTTKITDTDNLAVQNPIRYRGYYYDTETGFYYVSSRYYDPEIGRFINADTTDVLTASTMALTDKNLYAYCDNNPVTRKDVSGEFWSIVSGAVIGAVISAGIELGLQLATSGEIDVFNIGLAALGGAAGGALAATGLGYVGQAFGNAVISGVSEAASQIRSGNKDLGSILSNSGKMAVVGAVSVVIGGKGIKAKGTAYKNSLDNLKSVKGNITEALSNPQGYRQQINSAIKTHQSTTISSVKSTTVSFGFANFFTNVVSRVKNFFGW